MFLNDSDLIELHGEGAGDTEIAEILGSSPQSVRRHREKLGLPKNPRRNRFAKMFVAYDRDTGEFLAQGSMWELSCKLPYRETTLRRFAKQTAEDADPLPCILIYEVGHGI